jgi:hypothetical protein
VVALKPENIKRTFVKLKGEHVSRRAIEIDVTQAKNDQEGNGSQRLVPEVADKSLSLYDALDEYEQLRNKRYQFLFYNTAFNGHAGNQLASTTPSFVLRKRLTEAKVSKNDLTKYASNSLRKGGATSAFSAGFDRLLVKKHGAWKSDAGVNAYITVDKSLLAELVDSILSGQDDNEEEVED